MDGTLYNSMPNHVEAWLTMLAEQGIHANESDILLAEGRTGVNTITQMFERYAGRTVSREEAHRLYTRKAQLFASMPTVEVMEGAPELVDTLLSAGLITVLVTGSGQASLLGRLEKDFPGAFPEHRRVTALNVKHGKPSPEPFTYGMTLAGVEPHQALAFDNAPLGIQSASSADAVAVGVITGKLPTGCLTDARADIEFPSMTACAGSIRAYFEK